MSSPIDYRWYNDSSTPEFSVGKLLNTANPLSSLLPGQDYVPKWLVGLFRSGNDEKDIKDKKPINAARLLAKVALGMTFFGAGAVASRALMHYADGNTYNVHNTPIQGIEKFYQRPTQAALDIEDLKRKEKQQQEAEEGITKTSNAFMMTSIPLLAAIYASVALSKKADVFFDKKKISDLEKKQKQLIAMKNDLALKRIQIARDLEPVQNSQQNVPQEVTKQAALNKVALTDYITSAAGFLGPVIFLLGCKAGKYFHDENNEEYLKFKAAKKALQHYNKARAFQRGVIHQDLDPQLVAYLNSNLQKKPSQKKQLEAVTDSQTMKEILI